MSELLGKTQSLESMQPTLLPTNQGLPAYQGAAAKESGHACKGEGRCCGGCRNPKRPLASANEETLHSSNLEILPESAEPPTVQA